MPQHRRLLALGTILLLVSLTIPLSETFAQQPVFAFSGARMDYYVTSSLVATGVYAGNLPHVNTSHNYSMRVVNAGTQSAAVVYVVDGHQLEGPQLYIVYAEASPSITIDNQKLTSGAIYFVMAFPTTPPTPDGNYDPQYITQLVVASYSPTFLPDYIPPTSTLEQLKSMVGNNLNYLKSRSEQSSFLSTILASLTYDVKIDRVMLLVNSQNYETITLQITTKIDGANYHATGMSIGYYHSSSGILLKSDIQSDVQYQSAGGQTHVVLHIPSQLQQTNVNLQSATATTSTTSSTTSLLTSSSATSATQLVLQGFTLRKVGGVAFRVDTIQLTASASTTTSGISLHVPSTTTTLFANNLKIGSFTFGLDGTIAKANGGERDTVSGGSANPGDYLMRGTTVVGVQIDSLPSWQVNSAFVVDISSRVQNFVVDKVQDAVQQAISAGGEALIVTLNPQLLCGIIPVSAVVGNTPCGGSLVIVAASPVDLLVISPSGKMIGTAANGTQVNQLNGAWYSGKSVEPQIVWITQPEQGKYNATMTGTGTGNVGYAIASFTGAGALVNSFNSTVSQGQVLTSSISLSGGSLDVKPPALISSQSVGQQTSLSVPIELVIPIAVGIIVVVGLFFGIRSRRKTSAA